MCERAVCLIVFCFAARNDPTDPSLAVVMYDVETRQCVNEQMINLVSCEVAAPVLKKVK